MLDLTMFWDNYHERVNKYWETNRAIIVSNTLVFVMLVGGTCLLQLFAWKDTPYWETKDTRIIYGVLVFFALFVLLYPRKSDFRSLIGLSRLLSRHMAAFLAVACFYVATFGTTAHTMNTNNPKVSYDDPNPSKDCTVKNKLPLYWFCYLACIGGVLLTLSIAGIPAKPLEDEGMDKDVINKEVWYYVGTLTQLIFLGSTVLAAHAYLKVGEYKMGNRYVVPSASYMAVAIIVVVVLLAIILLFSYTCLRKDRVFSHFEREDRKLYIRWEHREYKGRPVYVEVEVPLILAFWTFVFANPVWAIAVPGRECGSSPDLIHNTLHITILLSVFLGLYVVGFVLSPCIRESTQTELNNKRMKAHEERMKQREKSRGKYTSVKMEEVTNFHI